MSKDRVADAWHRLPIIGVALGTLFFAASLTPTLLPRTGLVQGALSGCALAAGYGIGLFARRVWTYLELPLPGPRTTRVASLWITGAGGLIAIASLVMEVKWQNDVRRVMELEPIAGSQALTIGVVALATFAVLLVLGRLFRLTWVQVSKRARRVMPRRVANVVGILVAIVLFWSLSSGLLIRGLLHMADSSFKQYDALIEPERARPVSALKTGSDASLLQWDELGRAGREFLASGPTQDQLHACSGSRPLEPIRVYVGLRSAQTEKERAKLALEEIKRVGGFERSMLVILTPTGTGWIDPAAMYSLEYLTNGDVASVAMQYSYLASPLSLLVEPDYGAAAARALFREVYGYWTQLPKDRRPKLYLHGLSLGAMNSEQSADLFEVLGDPLNGALWSGPPYTSRHWAAITAARNPESPAWLPRFRDGAFVRFMNQWSGAESSAAWGPMRIVYLQYASDAVTFFEYSALYREPDWMKPPRGRDVSPSMRWYPVVTFLQLAVDMFLAPTTPVGYGHVYAGEHYVDAWLALTSDQGEGTAKEAVRLKQCLQSSAKPGSR